MKKVIFGFILGFLVCFLGSVFAQSHPIEYIWNKVFNNTTNIIRVVGQ